MVKRRVNRGHRPVQGFWGKAFLKDECGQEGRRRSLRETSENLSLRLILTYFSHSSILPSQAANHQTASALALARKEGAPPEWRNGSAADL